MKLSKAIITNFRGIRDLTIDFDPMINVFVGDNCSGKTAVLDAIAVALSTDPDIRIYNSDISKHAEFSSITLFDDTCDNFVNKKSTIGVSDEERVSVIYSAAGERLRRLMYWFYDMERVKGNESKLAPVKYAIKEFLPEFSDFYTECDPIRMIAVKNGEKFEMNQLSCGELAIIELVGSLAMKTSIIYHEHGSSMSCFGAVLIDDIDIHLHPAWQRIMIPKLLDIFPSYQFFISTNSPHVINTVRPESVFILENTDEGIKVKKTNESYGKTADRVLEDIMGLETTRPDKVAHDLHHIFELIDRGDLDAAKEHIVKMMSDIGADPDLVKARVLIKRMELIGK